MAWVMIPPPNRWSNALDNFNEEYEGNLTDKHPPRFYTSGFFNRTPGMIITHTVGETKPTDPDYRAEIIAGFIYAQSFPAYELYLNIVIDYEETETKWEQNVTHLTGIFNDSFGWGKFDIQTVDLRIGLLSYLKHEDMSYENS